MYNSQVYVMNESVAKHYGGAYVDVNDPGRIIFPEVRYENSEFQRKHINACPGSSSTELESMRQQLIR